jgi:hypothetical protein
MEKLGDRVAAVADGPDGQLAGKLAYRCPKSMQADNHLSSAFDSHHAVTASNQIQQLRHPFKQAGYLVTRC